MLHEDTPDSMEVEAAMEVIISDLEQVHASLKLQDTSPNGGAQLGISELSATKVSS